MRNMLLTLGLIGGLLAPTIVQAGDEFVPYQLGDTHVTIWIMKNGAGLTFFAPHDDENISATAGMLHVAEHGGKLVQLVYDTKRNIGFTYNGARYAFDPNRMFSDVGIEATLKTQGKNYSPEAHALVKQFARTVLEHVGKGLGQGTPIVALHNNSNGSYSLESYAQGGEYAKEAKAVYQNPKMDTDDFFFVTTDTFFNALKERGLNVVLQDNEKVTDDGSLSVLASRMNVPYVNVEAEEGGAGGHETVQAAMLRILEKVLQ